MKSNNRAFSWSGQVLLPPSLFQEARKLPSTVLSFEVAAEEVSTTYFNNHQTLTVVKILLLRFSLGEKHSEHLPGVALDLARNLNSHIQPLFNEITQCFDRIFLPPNSKPEIDGEWHSLVFHPTVLRVIGITVSRAFVGDLCSDEDFTKTIAGFATGVILQLFALQIIPGEYLKTQAAKVMPQRRRIATLREMVRKLVMARLEDIEAEITDAEVI